MSEIKLTPTFEHKFEENVVYCATMQYAWNELVTKIVASEFDYNHDNATLSRLVRENEHLAKIKPECMYATAVPMLTKHKAEIERELDSRFGEKSKLLDALAWQNGTQTDMYLAYCFLKKQMQFLRKFSDLGKFPFGGKTAKYFGMKPGNTAQGKAVHGLFYENSREFAVRIDLKDPHDVLILYRSDERMSLKEAYESCNQKMAAEDRQLVTRSFRMPEFSMDITQNFREICGEMLVRKNGMGEYKIEEAMQNVTFSIDKSGAKLISEACLAVKAMAFSPCSIDCDFLVDGSFYLFNFEADADTDSAPTLAMRVADIDLFNKK